MFCYSPSQLWRPNGHQQLATSAVPPGPWREHPCLAGRRCGPPRRELLQGRHLHQPPHQDFWKGKPICKLTSSCSGCVRDSLTVQMIHFKLSVISWSLSWFKGLSRFVWVKEVFKPLFLCDSSVLFMLIVVVLGLFFYCTVLYKYINKRADVLRYLEFLSPFHTFSTCKTIYILQALLFLEHV